MTDSPIPPPEPASDPLADAVDRSNHFERLLAAIVATGGPVQVSQAAYEAADPDRLTSCTGTVDGQPVVMFALPDQLAVLMLDLVGATPTPAGTGVDGE